MAQAERSVLAERSVSAERSVLAERSEPAERDVPAQRDTQAGQPNGQTAIPSTVQIARAPRDVQGLEWGRDIYNTRCYFCHGYSGDAKTVAASYLTPPPRDFTRASITREHMLDAVAHGRPGTGMMPFSGILSSEEIAAVVDFVRANFLEGVAPNTAYHTAANGWPDHERYASAFPFATGETSLDAPEDRLTPTQQAGRRLFLSACVTCHDRGGKGQNVNVFWNRKAISFPRGAYSHRAVSAQVGVSGSAESLEVDAVSGASPFAAHDQPPPAGGLSESQRHGKSIFEKNCAFCHAADGSGKNWIGSFLQPHPRDLTHKQWAQEVTPERVRSVIRDGIPNTTMSAWRNVLTAGEIEALVDYVMTAFIIPSQQ